MEQRGREAAQVRLIRALRLHWSTQYPGNFYLIAAHRRQLDMSLQLLPREVSGLL